MPKPSRVLASALLWSAVLGGPALAQSATAQAGDVSDAALVRTLPGFTEGVANVDGVRLHYVPGGRGDPVVPLPGWPQTWWSFHKVMPLLADRHRLIVVDLRGMGASDKPAGG